MSRRRLPLPWEILSSTMAARLHARRARRCATARTTACADHRAGAKLQADRGNAGGLDAARGDVIVTMDGDLQNDPIDIPRMVNRLLKEDLDLVAGWRKNRQDGLLLRKILPYRQPPDRPHDRRHPWRLRLQPQGLPWQRHQERQALRRGDAPASSRHIAATVTTPRRIAQEVTYARVFGESRYGISRNLPRRADLQRLFMRFAPTQAISSEVSASGSGQSAC